MFYHCFFLTLFYLLFGMPFSSTMDIGQPLSLASNDIVAESLEKLMENKLVREKRVELEKKLESLRKKHEKVFFNLFL